MRRFFSRKRWSARAAGFCLAAAACAVAASPAQAVQVGLVGLFPGKAVLVIDGGAPRTLAVGARVSGVRLLAVDAAGAMIEADGRRQRLVVGQHVHGGGGGGGAQTASLTADGRGHFFTTGTVNGATVRFMVDTGASVVALGAADARRANIDLAKARPTMVQTANGVAQAWAVTLDAVRVGDITLNGVAGVVHSQDLPMALLGMSFLNRMEMQRDGEILTLRKRY